MRDSSECSRLREVPHLRKQAIIRMARHVYLEYLRSQSVSQYRPDDQDINKNTQILRYDHKSHSDHKLSVCLLFIASFQQWHSSSALEVLEPKV